MAIWALSVTLVSTLLALTLASLSAAVISRRQRRRRAAGFFHPYTNDGGGGERVLWCAVRAVQEDNPDLDCAVYTGDDASPQSLAARALDRFGVKLLRPPQVIHLSRRKWIDERTYPHFTMIGQSLAHNSAGPKMDIVLEEDGRRTGFLASDKEEYADAILEILKMPESERLAIVAAARKRAQRFSEQKFYEDFKAAIRPIICGSSAPS
ncbi:hypothetical protein COCNU_14G010780 [Cocos nucifera]|uniref:ALG11 mannosyltransferase N-terminal domain-containing protein n=1 Tax=Cocos nucifera TaxID=13894 RepID=A0A8K0IVY3_COCNU|nr:hypothetical protein COCNU_14G010780 [Cocos nucifera]